MKSVIFKTALKTLLVVIFALLLAFGIASLGFPQHMATLFENVGAYRFAAGYAGLAYNYSGTTENLSRCVEDSILAHDDANIINYGKILVQREDFKEFPDGYRQFVAGNLACAEYLKGDKEGALETAKQAMESVEGFPANNALAALAIRSAENSDMEFSEKIYGIVIEIQPAEEDQNYYDSVLAVLCGKI